MQHPLSLEAFIAWLATQPANGRYDWTDSANCLGAQYLRARGFDCMYYGYNTWSDTNNPLHLAPAFIGDIAIATPWTYGAALKRAEAMLAATKPNG